MDNKNISVLIVEDEIIVAMEIEIRLKRNNFTVIGIAHNNKKAVELAIKHSPQIILMDINLKCSKDGIQTSIEILSVIKAKILFLSAYNDDETQKRIEVVPGASLLHKPFSVGELISGINSCFYEKNEMHKDEVLLQ